MQYALEGIRRPERYQVLCVPPAILGEVWPYAGPFLLRGQLEIIPEMLPALKALRDQILLVHSNMAHVWVVLDTAGNKIVAALISQTLLSDERRIIWVSRMSGENILGWGKLLSDTLADYARKEHAEAVRFAGRKALKRAYRNVHIVRKIEGSRLYLYERAVS
jgi:hypothetical protein